MASMKDIKRRIKSVESTMQITKAMELVASSKLRKAKERADDCQEYFQSMYEMVTNTALESPKTVYTNPVTDRLSVLLIVIAGDRGLAGGFNGNVLKMAERRISEIDGEVTILPMGKKSAEHFEKRPYPTLESYVGVAESFQIHSAEHISDKVMELFESRKINTVELIYTNYVSPLLQEPRMLTLLPIPNLEGKTAVQGTISPITEFEPSAGTVLEMLVPKYLAGMIYCTVVDSFASEQASRRIAMENASDNATEMIDTLSLQYNRARQSAITQEITEIVGGASSV